MNASLDYAEKPGHPGGPVHQYPQRFFVELAHYLSFGAVQFEIIGFGGDVRARGEDQPVIEQLIQRLDIASTLRGLQSPLRVPQIRPIRRRWRKGTRK